MVEIYFIIWALVVIVGFSFILLDAFFGFGWAFKVGMGLVIGAVSVFSFFLLLGVIEMLKGVL